MVTAEPSSERTAAGAASSCTVSAAGAPPPSASSLARCSFRMALRDNLMRLPSTERTLTRTWSPSFSSSLMSLMRCSATSLMCSRPSVPGMISTNAPNSARRVTVPRYVRPISGTAVMSPIIWRAFSAAAASLEETRTCPLSSTSIFTPVASTIPRITLPPGPISSRILSVGIMTV